MHVIGEKTDNMSQMFNGNSGVVPSIGPHVSHELCDLPNNNSAEFCVPHCGECSSFGGGAGVMGLNQTSDASDSDSV